VSFWLLMLVVLLIGSSVAALVLAVPVIRDLIKHRQSRPAETEDLD